MSESIAYWFAQTFALEGAQNVTVTDSAVTGATINLNGTTGTRYYRVFLAGTAGGSTTIANPTCLLHRVETQLGAARWQVRMQSSGKVRITYIGTGTGSITWSSTTVRNLLGFASNVSLAQNASVDGAYLPTHVIASIAFEEDTGWTRRGQRFAGVEMADGSVSGASDRTPRYSRSGVIGFLPKTWTVRTSIEAAGTPTFADSVSRWIAPGTTEPAQTPPWAVTDQLGVQIGQRWGVAWGDFQDLVAGTTSAFDVVTPRVESVRTADFRLVSAHYDERRSVPLEVNLMGTGSRA